MTTPGFLQRLSQALALLTGRAAEAEPEDKDVLSLRSRIQTLKMDLEERDQKIARMRQEFAHLQSQAATDRAGAGSAELAGLAKRLAPILSQLPTLRALHESGKEVRTTDLFTLFAKLEKQLAETGLQPVGTVGETCPFDPRFHQRMSGSDVNDGVQVRVRFIGYRFQETVLLKAMVSKED